MVNPLRVETPDESELIKGHERWLGGDKQALTRWRSRISELGEEHESAVAEAVVCWILLEHCAQVRLGEICGEGPDFHCSSNGDSRAVEVTNLSRGPLNEWYGFDSSELPPTGIGGLKLIHERVFGKVRGKATKQTQAAKTTAPFVLAVTTQHRTGAMEIARQLTASFLLTGQQSAVMWPSSPNGEKVPPTMLASGRHSAFHREHGSDSESLVPIRPEISGLLLVGIQSSCVEMIGILNPWTVKPIDSLGIAGLPTARVSGEDPNHFTVCWES